MISDISHPECDVLKIFKEFKHSRKNKNKMFNYFDLSDYLCGTNPCEYTNHIENATKLIEVWQKLGIIHKILDFKFGHITHSDWSHTPMPIMSFRSKWRKHLKRRWQYDNRHK